MRPAAAMVGLPNGRETSEVGATAVVGGGHRVTISSMTGWDGTSGGVAGVPCNLTVSWRRSST